MNNRATELSSVKCADSAGNSLVVSGVITYRVVDAARAVLDMGPQLDQYVHGELAHPPPARGSLLSETGLTLRRCHYRLQSRARLC